MRYGIYVWWCGGKGSEGEGPEHVWPHDRRYSGVPATGSEADKQGVIHDVDTICISCGRLAPFANGCRWVDWSEMERLLAADGDFERRWH